MNTDHTDEKVLVRFAGKIKLDRINGINRIIYCTQTCLAARRKENLNVCVSPHVSEVKNKKRD